jgi:hypothetical protein
LKRHSFEQRRFSRTGLADHIYVRKTIFVFDTKYAGIIAEIGPANVRDITALHIPRMLSRWSNAEEEFADEAVIGAA